MKKAYPGQVVTNRMFSTVLMFSTEKQADKFCRFIRAKYNGVAYATAGGCEVLFETTDKSLFNVCLDKMHEYGLGRS